jgi:hypothetical protein
MSYTKIARVQRLSKYLCIESWGFLKADKTHIHSNVISSFPYKREGGRWGEERHTHRSCLHMKMAKQILNNYTFIKKVIARLYPRSHLKMCCTLLIQPTEVDLVNTT